MREKLIELLKQSEKAYAKFVHETSFMPDTAKFTADHLIANGVTIQKWIPVTERLPDEFEQFLCVVIRPIQGGKYVREYRVLWCDYDRIWNCEGLIVTHWMPLPAPPAEVSP